MAKRKYDICPCCKRPFSKAEREALRRQAFSEGAKRSWQDPVKRHNRVTAMRKTWDDPLQIALMRKQRDEAVQ